MSSYVRDFGVSTVIPVLTASSSVSTLSSNFDIQAFAESVVLRSLSDLSSWSGGSKFKMTMNVDEEIERLKTEIARLGAKCDDGSITVKFGTLFNDDRCANIFEALVGTLRAAKKRKIVTFDAEMLFQGVHDNVDIVLVKPKDVNVDVVPLKPKEDDADVIAQPKDVIADVTPAEPEDENAQA